MKLIGKATATSQTHVPLRAVPERTAPLPRGRKVEVPGETVVEVVALVKAGSRYSVVTGKTRMCDINGAEFGEPTNVGIARAHMMTAAEDVLIRVHAPKD